MAGKTYVWNNWLQKPVCNWRFSAQPRSWWNPRLQVSIRRTSCFCGSVSTSRNCHRSLCRAVIDPACRTNFCRTHCTSPRCTHCAANAPGNPSHVFYVPAGAGGVPISPLIFAQRVIVLIIASVGVVVLAGQSFSTAGPVAVFLLEASVDTTSAHTLPPLVRGSAESLRVATAPSARGNSCGSCRQCGEKPTRKLGRPPSMRPPALSSMP